MLILLLVFGYGYYGGVAGVNCGVGGDGEIDVNIDICDGCDDAADGDADCDVA